MTVTQQTTQQTQSVTQPCGAPTTGTLRPDQRVNYTYGMVLGLDEFLQEQTYFLAKDHLHERALHGYGTVSGLAVSASDAPGGNDVQVTVTEGIAIDQWGREIVIRCDQCARLGAWLGAQETAEPGILGRNLGPSGELTVYVVASYAECLDDLVPIPGQPCSTSDKAMVPSRIRSAWDVDFRWAPPPMPRWDSDRRLARLLASVEIVVGLDPADSDEAAITDAVLELAELADDGPSSLGPDPDPSATDWRLPAETAADAFDRILTAWVTRVRPELHPELTDPEAASDPAILLAAISVVPATPFDAGAPAIADWHEPDESGRPYLLHTELIQELRLLGQATDIELPEPPDPAHLVTLSARSASDERTVIDAWFHLPDGVRLPETITVHDEAGRDADFDAQPAAVGGPAPDFSDRWLLTAQDQGVMDSDGLQISALFPGDRVHVGDDATLLLDSVDPSGSYLDVTPQGDVVAYAEIVRPAEARTPPPPPAVASVEFLTVAPVSVNEKLALLELWFHLQPRGELDDAFALRPAFRLFDETTGNELQFRMTGPAPWSRNVWRIEVEVPEPGKGVPLYLRYVFLAKEFGVESPGGDLALAEWIEKAPALFIGWDRDRTEVIAFSRTDVPGEQPQEPFPTEVRMPVDRPLRPLREILLERRDAGEGVVTPVKKAAVRPVEAPAKKAVVKKAADKPASKSATKSVRKAVTDAVTEAVTDVATRATTKKATKKSDGGER